MQKNRCSMFFPSLICLLSVTLFPVEPIHAAWQQDQESKRSPLENVLRSRPVADLAARVMSQGDAARGAMLYYNPELTCVKCHERARQSHARLGPAIDEVNREATVEFLIESVLDPSSHLTEGFRTETVLTVAGNQITGLVSEEDKADNGYVLLVDPDQNGKMTRIAQRDIEDRRTNTVSAMPLGLVGALNDEQSFLDLIRYLVEIKKEGKRAVVQLRPPESFFAVTPIPEYEADVDHAGLIGALNEDNLLRGKAIYQRFCARCHGTREQEGTMPSALRFMDGVFKNGNDPHGMYATLTHGYGLMVPQRWMVPKQKYDVIHYIREHFIKPSNPDGYFNITGDYLAGLPAGTVAGPDPVDRTPWADMDYGNFLINTYESGKQGTNIAFKGIAVRLDKGPGGVSQGRHWILYEHDTMRVAAAWSGNGFIDYNGIHFNDQHNVHPRIVGDVHFTNDHRPGWANPQTHSFDADPRVVGRDDVRYGPLPDHWLKYRGLYQYDDRVVVHYTVGDTKILESPSLDVTGPSPAFQRNLEIGSRKRPLLVRVASVQDLTQIEGGNPHVAGFAQPNNLSRIASPKLDGNHHLVARKTLDWNRPLTIAARIRTEKGGTIVCQTADQSEWVPGGTSLFVRDGRLVFDIGWVGAVASRQRIDDGQWHSVGLAWDPANQSVNLYVDGNLDRQGNLKPGKKYASPVLRIGYTADNFPEPQSMFVGELSHLRIWNQLFTEREISEIDFSEAARESIADWQFDGTDDTDVLDRTPAENHAAWIASSDPVATSLNNTWSSVAGLDNGQWRVIDGSLCLEIPAGESPLSISITTGTAVDQAALLSTVRNPPDRFRKQPDLQLSSMTRGGPSRYPEVLTAPIETMPYGDSDPFVVDYLTHPKENPWACRMRFTGIEFVNDDKALVCSWDGSVWEVTGFLKGTQTSWRRIACGLFQPLGIRMMDGRVYVSCRDQIVVLEDLNGDGSTDYYRTFNSDHQVTEHFHEFAMGLQSDDAGNLYYAKSARHALPALVPHHGTLLKVSADGSTTEIIANGFRAANGVCVNPDGSFFVTDQEGHWMPKNRINWVQPGGFYGNMLGYHDVTDPSDEAMEEPLCWITNAFDRSPGELLRVPDDCWGPLEGSLLNLSYGMGQVFVVAHESVSFRDKPQLQGGMCSLPVPLFPTGVMRGRFHVDGQLYCCGMYAWAGNQQKPGGIYRIRYTGEPVFLIRKIETSSRKIALEFASPLNADAAADPGRYVITTWDLSRSSNYGSPHLNERQLEVSGVSVSSDGRKVELTVPGLRPTRGMEIRCLIPAPDGRDLTRTIHNTIHVLGDAEN